MGIPLATRHLGLTAISNTKTSNTATILARSTFPAFGQTILNVAPWLSVCAYCMFCANLECARPVYQSWRSPGFVQELPHMNASWRWVMRYLHLAIRGSITAAPWDINGVMCGTIIVAGMAFMEKIVFFMCMMTRKNWKINMKDLDQMMTMKIILIPQRVTPVNVVLVPHRGTPVKEVLMPQRVTPVKVQWLSLTKENSALVTRRQRFVLGEGMACLRMGSGMLRV